MSKYCIVIADEVTWGPGPLPERITLADGTTRTSLDELSAAELLAIDLWPVVETIPSYDQNSQRLVSIPTLTVDTDHVDAEYTVENLPSLTAVEARTVAKKERGIAAWAALATAMDVPVKIDDLALARRIKAATLAEETFAVEIEDETLTLTPAEIAILAKDARAVYVDNGGDFETLEDPDPVGVDLTFQFEFYPDDDYLVKCIVRLIRAQWHTTGYDLPPTAVFGAEMIAGSMSYTFSYIGDWFYWDSAEVVSNNTAVKLQGFNTQNNITGWWEGAQFSTSADKYLIAADVDLETFKPTTGVRKVIRTASYTEAVFTPEHLTTCALPVGDPVSTILGISASWPDFSDTSLWSWMPMGASTIAEYHEWFGEANGHTGKHYQFGNAHSYQGPTDPAPSVEFMTSWAWPLAPAAWRGHKVNLMVMAGSGDAHCHVQLTSAEWGTVLADVERTVAFPGFTVNGETFNCA